MAMRWNNKKGLLYEVFIILLTHVGGEAVLGFYPPRLIVDDNVTNIPAYGDGRNWLNLAKNLEEVGFISVEDAEGDTCHVTLSPHVQQAVAPTLNFLTKRLKKGFREKSIENVDEMF